jgi:hypothetical protein
MRQQKITERDDASVAEAASCQVEYGVGYVDHLPNHGMLK